MEHLSTREKMQGMSSKQKANYIWYYYKFHFIGAIVLICMIISFIVSAANSKTSALGVTLMGSYADTNKLDELKNRAEDALIKDNKKKQEIRIEYLQKTDTGMDEMTSVSLQKLMATISAKEIDILILDKKDFENYAKQGTFKKLSSVPQLSTIDFTGYEFVKAKATDTDTTEEAYGISLDNLPALKDVSFDTKNKVLCIVTNGQHVDKAVEFIKWIFTIKSL